MNPCLSSPQVSGYLGWVMIVLLQWFVENVHLLEYLNGVLYTNVWSQCPLSKGPLYRYSIHLADVYTLQYFSL